MKKTPLFILIILIATIFVQNALAWDECPFGIEDDPQPGLCSRYVDTNGDGICDHSQSEPAEANPDESSQGQTQTQVTSSRQCYENKNVMIMIISFFIILGGGVLLKIFTKKQIISKTKDKIIWNILLLIFFFPSAITGILLVLMVEFPVLREISLNFIELHSYNSVFFMWISGYHIIWHTRCYTKNIKSMLSSNKLIND
jgi:hypothetical protein